ncbi:MAG: Holliday junction resolvase RuvX [Candidatus Ratteibacteria bacterium]
MKILALDLGERKIGVAISDPGEELARGIGTIQCNGKETEKIIEIVQLHKAEKIVYGVPIRNDGSLSPKGAKLLHLIDKLRLLMPEMEFIPWDERFTTVEAEKILLSANLSRAKRKRLRDKLAAQIILQSYLDSKRPIVPDDFL